MGIRFHRVKLVSCAQYYRAAILFSARIWVLQSRNAKRMESQYFSRLVGQQVHILSRHSRRLKQLTSTSGTHMERRKVMLYIDPLEQSSSMAGTLISSHLAVLNITNISSIIRDLTSTPIYQMNTISLGYHNALSLNQICNKSTQIVNSIIFGYSSTTILAARLMVSSNLGPE